MTAVTVANDIDGDPRPNPANAPDRGADEVVKAHGGTVAAGTYYNAMINGPVALGGDVNVMNTLNLSGVLMTGPNTLGLGCDVATVAGAGEGSYVEGKVRKDFCSATPFSYPAGAGSGYSPVDVTPLAGSVYPSSLTINAVDDFLPGIVQTSAASRYWTVTKTGTIIVNMAMHYRVDDVNGNENTYRAFRSSGGVTGQHSPSTVDTAANIVTAMNVSTFSDWGIASLLAPTAALMDLSGTVKTASGLPIRNVIVVISGPALTQPRYAQTGSLGVYKFTGLPAGSYVVSISSKRFTFSIPVIPVNLNESLDGQDFTSDPQE